MSSLKSEFFKIIKIITIKVLPNKSQKEEIKRGTAQSEESD